MREVGEDKIEIKVRGENVDITKEIIRSMLKFPSPSLDTLWFVDTLITNLQASWVCLKSMQILLFHRFVLFKHECCVLLIHRSRA
jgi:hypothetical protein